MALRAGLVGTGHWASEVHAASLLAHQGVELVGIWGRDPARTAQVAADLGTTAYPYAEALFAAVDVVSFAVPPDVQAPLAAQAATARCHLLLEKPVATDLALAQAVADAVEAAKVASIVFFTRRFVPENAAWLEQITAQGGWTGGHFEWIGNIFETDNPFGRSVWRREQGALWDVGPHVLSLLLPVLGTVESVTALAGPADTTHLLLRHADGATVTATLSLTVPSAAGGQSLHLYGTQGRTEAPRADFDPVDCHGRAIDALLAEVAGTAHPCDVGFGLEVTRILAAAERSRSTGLPVTVAQH